MLFVIQSVVERLFKHLDPNDDGQITFAEFTKAFIDIDLAQLCNLDLPVRVATFLKRVEFGTFLNLFDNGICPAPAADRSPDIQ